MAARWPAAAVVSGLLVVLCVVLLAAVTPASAQPEGAVVISSSTGKRTTKFTCKDDGLNVKGQKKRKPDPPCTAECPSRCPNSCLAMCPKCKTMCLCDFYPGASCGDPRFTGGDGNNFYFHGKKDQDFCIVADSDLHVNAHFIGNHNPATGRDFTWIQAIGVLFDHHRFSLGAVRSAKWNPVVDHFDIAFDDERVTLPLVDGARWSPASAPALSIKRTAPTNGIMVELKGVFRLIASAVPITAQESSVHNYGVTADDCLVHLDLGFKFQSLSDDVHGVLGQTYRSDYVSKLNVAAKMPIMDGAADYVSSGLFATDCAVARFGHGSGIAMVTNTKVGVDQASYINGLPI